MSNTSVHAYGKNCFPYNTLRDAGNWCGNASVVRYQCQQDSKVRASCPVQSLGETRDGGDGAEGCIDHRPASLSGKGDKRRRQRFEDSPDRVRGAEHHVQAALPGEPELLNAEGAADGIDILDPHPVFENAFFGQSLLTLVFVTRALVLQNATKHTKLYSCFGVDSCSPNGRDPLPPRYGTLGQTFIRSATVSLGSKPKL